MYKARFGKEIITPCTPKFTVKIINDSKNSIKTYALIELVSEDLKELCSLLNAIELFNQKINSIENNIIIINEYNNRKNGYTQAYHKVGKHDIPFTTETNNEGSITIPSLLIENVVFTNKDSKLFTIDITTINDMLDYF